MYNYDRAKAADCQKLSHECDTQPVSVACNCSIRSLGD